MASLCQKRKQPNGPGAAMRSAPGFYGPPGDVVNLYPPESSPRDRRKRRKDKLPWVEHTFTPYFDGHSWQKYGEKVIKDCPFHRLYFRCAYHDDKKCMASKQVQQKSLDDPPLFSVTYEHEHTCDAVPIPAPDVVVSEAEPPAGDGMVLRFGHSGGSHNRYVQMQKERQQYHEPVPPVSPFLMNFDSSEGLVHEQQPTFPSSVPPTAASWPSSSFAIIESCPAPPSMDHEGGMLSRCEWDLLRYCLDDHLQCGDHLQCSDNSSGSLFSWSPTDLHLPTCRQGLRWMGVIF